MGSRVALWTLKLLAIVATVSSEYNFISEKKIFYLPLDKFKQYLPMTAACL